MQMNASVLSNSPSPQRAPVRDSCGKPVIATHEFFGVPPDTQKMRLIVRAIPKVEGVGQQSSCEVGKGKISVHHVHL